MHSPITAIAKEATNNLAAMIAKEFATVFFFANLLTTTNAGMIKRPPPHLQIP